MGGVEACLQEITELCEYPLTHPELYVHLGVEPPRGVLLHGPPGCGKTMLAQAIAGELGVAFYKVAAPEIVSGMSGESEEKLRAIFEDALASAPSVIFLDEIDAITPKREPVDTYKCRTPSDTWRNNVDPKYAHDQKLRHSGWGSASEMLPGTLK